MKKKSSKKIKIHFKLKTFLVFLGLSLLFWTLIKLSKTYTSTVVFNVKYYNLPTNSVVQNTPINSVKASVTSTGFSLLNYKLKTYDVPFNLQNLSYKKANDYYYLPNNHLAELSTNFDVETSIKHIFKDSILIVLGKNKSKKVPVKLVADIQFKSGYNYGSDIEISPKYITVTGPEIQLDSIDSIETEKLEMLQVSSPINEEVPLFTKTYNHISFSTTKVLVTAKVDKFTEGAITVPFSILNLPENYNITTFPKKVKVTFRVGLTNFNKISANNIKVVCDFEESSKNGLNYLIPKIIEKSDLISTVKITPNKIDYLIEK